MHRMTLKSLLASLSAFSLLTACSGGDSTGPSGSGTEAVLAGAQWKLSANTIDPGIDVDGSGKLVTDLLAEDDECDRDDFVVFSADHKYTEDHGAVKCDPAESQTVAGTWSLNAAGDALTITLNGKSQSGKIVQATATKLVFTQSGLPFPDGKSHTVTFTYVPK
jgi:hypothetical protein